MNKIYISCAPIQHGDVMGAALAEDGTVLANHLSSGPGWSQHDMGVTSDWKHDRYKAHYPDGYELEWIDYEDLDSHPGWREACRLNKLLPDVDPYQKGSTPLLDDSSDETTKL